MSYENVPKDPTEQTVLTADYFIEAANRSITGTEDVFQTGRNLSISSTAYETLWDQGGNYTYLTVATQLYVSSSSASDTDQTIRVCGLDGSYNILEIEVTLNGQTQVAIPAGIFLRVREVEALEGSPLVGEVYVAESDTLTAGVPNTASKIKSKIALVPSETGDFASNHVSHNGFFTVPADSDVFIIAMPPTVPKNEDVKVQFWVRGVGRNWANLFGVWTYSGVSPVSILSHTRIAEKKDVEIRVLSGNPAGQAEVNLQLIFRTRVT